MTLGKKASISLRIRLKRALSRLAADESGVTAIEFAAVGPVFLALLLMIVETGIVFGANQMLENAVYNASRQILTGQLQSFQNNGGSANATYCKIIASICGSMSPILDPASCYSNVQIDLKVHKAGTPFSNAELATPVNAAGQLDQSKLNRGALGSRNDYMLIRAYYQYPVYTAHIGGGTGATDSGKRLLIGSAALALEPFSGSGSDTSAALVSASCTPP